MRLKPLITVLIAALTAYSGFWYYLAYYAEDRVQAMLGDLARSGFEFDYKELDVSGFPYRLVLDFKGVEAEYQDGPLRIDWSGPSLQAVLQPWQPGHAVLFAPRSLFSISYRTDQTNAAIIEPKLLSLSIRSKDRDGDRYSLVLEDSRIQPLSLGAGEIFLKGAELHFRSKRLQAAGATVSGLVEPVFADISVAINGLNLGARRGNNQATIIDQFTIDLQPRGRFFPRLTPYSLAAWRDAGSTVDIGNIDARWGGVVVGGDGSVTLDDDLQPLGAISLRTTDPEGLLDNISGAGWISSQDRQDAAEIIELFRDLGSPGSPVALSISLQGGSVAMGPVVLAEIGPLVRP